MMRETEQRETNGYIPVMLHTDGLNSCDSLTQTLQKKKNVPLIKV